mmetsp:Transcript_18992/g.28586  ORF Transcript_18992/g.28586 Transcript_18992/m.28586 type:complete len:91 (+) Transcript_18992:831-1103(+)
MRECDNCRGVGHPRRLCPSPRKYRTFEFAIELLRAARDRADARAQQQGGPACGGRRPPPRGQRPPFLLSRKLYAKLLKPLNVKPLSCRCH